MPNCCAADDDPLTRQTDVIAYNRYYGWYDGDMADIGAWADRVHARASPRVPWPSASTAQAPACCSNRIHPRARFPRATGIRSSTRRCSTSPIGASSRPVRICGPISSGVGFDLASAGRDEGDHASINDKGLVTYDRQTRKDAWYWYQANWSRVPMVYLTSRRPTPRTGEL